MAASSDTMSTVATPIARGVGYAVVGPAIGAALSAPDVRAAVWGLALPLGVGLAGAVALGVVFGLWLGRR